MWLSNLSETNSPRYAQKEINKKIDKPKSPKQNPKEKTISFKSRFTI